ncbi:MAG: hypothetical protein K9W45_03665 [Candidatus Heimdallarchaeum aukensis]|uniref:Polysaccharide biosynthesis protein C-terminal domain-containing protein n=1 Tax=Candidatus Heimdallarchaeum aukensis TaxID=2876573 RepID=A0A9Y1BMR4_9ARCH|nr:MAG: hypothetical protein K9W45_03665 [Candidatus Heimdallarchaeum aukensis]
MKDFIKQPLYQNSIYQMLSFAINSISGFIFWLIGSRIYPPNIIGINSTLVSNINLITLISMIGLNISILKFKEQYKIEELFGTYLKLLLCNSTVTSTVVIIILLLTMKELLYYLPFSIILFFVITSIFQVTYVFYDSYFLASNKSKYSLISASLASSLKIGLIFITKDIDVFGLLLSWGVAIGITILVLSLFFVNFKFLFSAFITSRVNIRLLKDTFNFSFDNYFATIFYRVPGLLAPTIVAKIVGVEYSAYLFIAGTFSAIIAMIPKIISQTMLAHVSHDSSKRNALETLFFALILVVIGIIIIFIFGDFFLNFFGVNYSVYSFKLLMLLSLGIFFSVFNFVFIMYKNSKGESKYAFKLHLIYAITCIPTMIIGVIYIGYLAVGYSILIANIVEFLAVILICLKNRESDLSN